MKNGIKVLPSDGNETQRTELEASLRENLQLRQAMEKETRRNQSLKSLLKQHLEQHSQEAPARSEELTVTSRAQPKKTTTDISNKKTHSWRSEHHGLKRRLPTRGFSASIVQERPRARQEIQHLHDEVWAMLNGN